MAPVEAPERTTRAIRDLVAAGAAAPATAASAGRSGTGG
jgi:hypothetical protein